jgi:hypothetical protein
MSRIDPIPIYGHAFFLLQIVDVHVSTEKKEADESKSFLQIPSVRELAEHETNGSMACECIRKETDSFVPASTLRSQLQLSTGSGLMSILRIGRPLVSFLGLKTTDGPRASM